MTTQNTSPSKISPPAPADTPPVSASAWEPGVQTWPVSQIHVGARYRQDLGNLTWLRRSVELHGLINPLVVSSDGELVAGARRLAVIRELGWAEVEVRILKTS